MGQNKFSTWDRLRSFGHAFNGLKTLFKTEHNARIHLFAAILVCLAGFLLRVSKTDWMALVIVIGLVMGMELVNSAIERIANFISPDRNDEIKKIKDLAAAAVLVMAITAMLVALLVFFPKLYS